MQALFATILLLAFTTLAVDIGLYFTSRCELQRAADAAGLAGVECLRDDDPAAAIAAATAYARANAVAGHTLPLAAVGVAVGHYTAAGRIFRPGDHPYNAVRVHLERSVAAGNPLRTYFGQVFGLTGMDVRVSMVARQGPAADYKIVGLAGVKFGSVGVLAAVHGRVASNGDLSIGMPLGAGVSVDGDVISDGGTVRLGGMAALSGTERNLPEPLDYPSVTLPDRNDNARLAGRIGPTGDLVAAGVLYVPPGVYVVRNLTMLATAAVDLSGPVTFYVTGTFTFAGTVTLLGNTVTDARMFKVRVPPGGSVLFVADLLTPTYMDLYAPDSDIQIAVAVPAYTGRLVGKTLNILLPVAGSFTEDRTLPSPLPPGRQTALVG